MQSKYKISVIVPIYNVAEYLQECLDSLLAQTIDSLEVIMVDDGSTDISGTIAKSYADKYDNFFYYYKENGGLGHARNYGIQFVHGDYIIFLDSDDVVPSDAYEEMYNKAIETGNDMVVGDVQRFDSRHVFNSGLHRKAFRDACDKTTILKTPELIYDTTSWNKLIKFSYWQKHQFKFPEKILYEDIPVTMPLHFFANGVSIVNKIVYLWRTRDGANKSITQNRTEMKNFVDRVTIMKMVDKFYEENVHDENALYMKDYKWMSVDLKLYIQEMLTADDEFIDYAIDTISEYVKGFRKDSFEALSAIDRMKYYLIDKKDKKRLLELLKYEKTSYNILKVKKKKSGQQVKYIGCFPFKDFPSEYYDMSKELNLNPITRVLQKVYWQGNKLHLEGYSFIRRLTCSSKNSQHITASLLNVKTGERVSLPIETCKANGVRGKHGFKVDRENKKFHYFNYKWAGFHVVVDFNNEKIMKLASGQLKIEFHYTRDGINRDYYIGGPVKGNVTRPKQLIVGNKIIKPNYNLGYDLCINCEEVLCHVEKISFIQNQLVISGRNLAQGGISLCQLNDDNKLALNMINNDEVAININSLQLNQSYHLEIKDTKTYLASNILDKAKYFDATSMLIKAKNNKRGEVELSAINHHSVVKKLSMVNNVVHVETKLNTSQFNHIINAVELVLKGSNSRLESNKIKASKLNKSSDACECSFDIDLNNETFTKNLVADRWFMSIQYLCDDGVIEESIYGDDVENIERFAIDDYNYSVYATDDGELIIKVSQKWKWYESNKLRRKVIEVFVYPLLRLLPLKKKTIVFEGWWGQKFHCNPRAFYEYMDQKHPDYKCIWSMCDERTPINGNGKTVRRKSLKYHYYMARAKYFINNVNFMDSYEKRKKQVEVQTMHGTPLKTLGLDVPGELPTQKDVDKFLRKCNRWNYLVVQSKKAEQITASCYAFKKQFLQTGYPRNDVMFAKNNPQDIAAIKKKLGIPVDKKVVMYAPTWRVRNQFNMNMDIKDLRERIQDKYVMMLRIHPFAVKGLDESLLDDFIYNVSNYPTVEELYLISDIVITDYSSVMFDYAILNRPMLFYTYDLEDYRDTLRGFNFDFVAEAPGPLLKNSKEVVDAIVNIEQVAAQHDEALQRFRKKFCEYEKGNASEQIYQIVMKK